MDFIARLKGFFSGREERPEIGDSVFLLGDFMGMYSTSPNGRWLVSWMDADPAQRGVGGSRPGGDGAYLLYDKAANRVVVRGRTPRPSAGRVANNGTFCLEDRDFGSALSGTLRVFSCSGHAIAQVPVTANIVRSALSENGAFALIHTANSPTDDGSKLFLVDLQGGKVRYRVTPSAGWPDRYGFVEEQGMVIAYLEGLGEFRYGPDGAFIDEDKLDRAMLDSPRYEHAIPAAEKLLSQAGTSEASAQEALRILLRVRQNGADMADAWHARCLKLIGQAHEALGENRDAIAAYDQALSIDPKIGVKRRRDSLQKRL
ncbi:tetratricopeptide repeat protein [Pseudomonas aeruginosa]|uniref:tetratricopeptide repeat protein n=1 Tax=Pseudomonas aeruginosa TaxID=287 RepID=UPI000B5A93A1|nr:tetratricopeptide repeat protein [Pseudomonas aeruginosa]ASJ88774.1 Tetratricopeptide repeat protein [Pseudomonas aeruginosa]RUE86354.1 tetratricopeptide repeat protein [Pseudomonas aeruginosa]